MLDLMSVMLRPTCTVPRVPPAIGEAMSMTSITLSLRLTTAGSVPKGTPGFRMLMFCSGSGITFPSKEDESTRPLPSRMKQYATSG